MEFLAVVCYLYIVHSKDKSSAESKLKIGGRNGSINIFDFLMNLLSTSVY